MDARSYAFTVLAATCSMFLLLKARHNGHARYFVLYTIVTVLNALMSVYTLMLPATQLVVILLDPLLRKRWKKFLVSFLVIAIGAVWVVSFTYKQNSQINWIPSIGKKDTLYEVLIQQFFGDAHYISQGTRVSEAPFCVELTQFALALLILILAALGGIQLFKKNRFYFFLLITWILLPLILVFSVQIFLHKTYYLPRYLSFTIPALAVLAALAFYTAKKSFVKTSALKPMTVAFLLVILIITFPSYLRQRSPLGANSSDAKIVATIIQSESRSGEGFILGPGKNMSFPGYRPYYDKLKDVALKKPASETKSFFYERDYSKPWIESRLPAGGAVWLIIEKGNKDLPLLMAELGYRKIQTEGTPWTLIGKYVK